MTDNQQVATELFVVGNGLDLQCGLETTYENFLKYVFLQKKSELSIDTEEIDLSIVADRFENRFDFYSTNWFEHSGKEVYSFVNIWYQIFLHEKMLENRNWSNVESMIAHYLKEEHLIYNIASVIKYKKRKLVSLGKQTVYRVPNMKGSQTNFIAKLAYVLVKKDLAFLQLPETESYQKIKEIYDNVVEYELEDIQSLVADVLLHELNELEYDFQCFLRYRLSETPNYDEKINTLLRRMVDPEKDMFTAVPIPYHLLSFNYSSLWSQMFRLQFSPVKFLDVHGKIPDNEGLRFSNIIFGVDHSLFQASELEYRFTKTYRTLKSYTQDFEKIGEGRDIYTKDIQTIKFYGHSLAEADYAYFQQLFDYYDLYSNPNLSLIFFYSIYDNSKSHEIEHEQIMAISRLIEKYGQTLDNKDHGKNLLTRLIQTKRLQMIKI
ncbi:TPA: AbiH family protein [Streptococcus suis]